MRKSKESTVKNTVYKALDALVNDNKAVTALDASSWSVGLAVKHGINPNTVDRYRRQYIAERLAYVLEKRENTAFNNAMNNINKA